MDHKRRKLDETCGVGLLLSDSGTALAGGLSTFILAFLGCSLSERVPLVPRFAEKERICVTDGLKWHFEDNTAEMSHSTPRETVSSQTLKPDTSSSRQR